MRFKIGDRVKVVKDDISWSYWVFDMSSMVGKTYTIIDFFTFSDGNTHPVVEFSGHYRGIDGLDHYAIPEDCLKHVERQMQFAFMLEATI